MKLENIVANSGYYIALETNGEESYLIGLLGSFPDEIPTEKRISIATPDMKITNGNTNVFLSTTLKSAKKIRGKYQTLEAFLSEKKKLIPLTVSC